MPDADSLISDGALLVRGRRVVSVGRWKDLAAHHMVPVLDLGDVIVLPGLINAHCHLDYTDMAGQFPPPRSFADWIRLIKESKSGWDFSDYLMSWSNGADMLLRTGTTSVGDVEAIPRLLPTVWEGTPLRVTSFLEMIALAPPRAARQVLTRCLNLARELGAPRGRLGLSPHAPYSTIPDLLRLSAEAARRRKWRVMIHVAESALEFEMFARARGELHHWLARMGRDMSDCGLGSPVKHLVTSGLAGENVIAVHANYLAPGDITLLANHRMHVAHCPRSHSYFQHRPFPLRSLLRAGVNVCLGTDSLASVYRRRGQAVELNMFDEMRAVASAHPGLRPATVLKMATVNGAHALGLDDRAGRLCPGGHADLIGIPFSGSSSRALPRVLEHTGSVGASMIDGEWCIPPQMA